MKNKINKYTFTIFINRFIMSDIFDAFTDFIAVFPNGNLIYFNRSITYASNTEINEFIEYTNYLLINKLLHFNSVYEYSKYYDLMLCLKNEYDRRLKPQLSLYAEEYVPFNNTKSINIYTNHTYVNRKKIEKANMIKIKPI